MKERATPSHGDGAADASSALPNAPERARPGESAAPGPEYLAAVVASAVDAIFTIGLDGIITSWNDGAERLYGYPSAEAIGEHVTMLAGYRNSVEAEDYLGRLMSGERIDHLKVERRHKDGRILFVSLTLAPVHGADGSIVGASTIARDISQEREWADRLTHLARRAERQAAVLDVVLRTTPDLLVLYDAEGRYMYASDSVLSALGMTLDHLYGRSHGDLIKGNELLDKLEAARQAAARKRSETVGALSIDLAHGRRTYTYTITPVEDAGGQLTGCLATLRDDSARLSAEAVLQEEKVFTDAVIDAAPGIFFTTDRDGRLVRWNAEAERFLGSDPSEMAGADTLSMVVPEDRAAASASITEAMESGASQVQLRIEGAAGIRESLVSTRRTDIGGAPYLVGFSIDMTERVRSEELVRQARDDLELRVAERTAELQAANKRLQRTERALMTLSWSNQTLLEATDAGQLLRDVCTAAVEVGGYLMCWVGAVENDEARTVRPVARAGRDDGFLDEVEITWGSGASGQGTAGRAVRSVSAAIVSDIETDPSYEPWREASLARGYRSALSLPLTDPRGITWGVLCLFAGEAGVFDDREVALLEELAMDLAFGIEGIAVRAKREEAEGDLRESYVRLEHMMQDTVGAMGHIVEARDPYTQGHERRVAEVAQALCREMGLDEDAVAMVRMASLLHDIGKLAVPAEILTKPGTLSGSEFEMIKDHSRQGYEILREITFPWPIADIVLQHHERMDGSGYPAGLKGEQILQAARILAVADVVEAMASHRPYRPSIGLAQALQALRDGPAMFDPEVVAACERLYARGEIRL